MRAVLSLAVLASTVLANTSPALIARQLVEIPCSETGQQDCHGGCIDLGWTCCRLVEGGCPPTQYCNDVGCCPLGEVCSGGGGVITNPGGTITNTITNTLTNTLTNTETETATATATEEEPTTEVVPPSSSKPVIPTGEPTSSEVVPTPTPSASATESTTAPDTPIFTGGAVANVIPGVGAVAGLLAALL